MSRRALFIFGERGGDRAGGPGKKDVRVTETGPVPGKMTAGSGPVTPG